MPLIYHKEGVGKKQFSVFPKAPEQRVIYHIDYVSAAHALCAKDKGFVNGLDCIASRESGKWCILVFA